jgi:hypothetical protein
MQRTISMLGAGFVLALAPATASMADSPQTSNQHLEHLMVENADTPAEHQALAKYYRMKATDAKSLAEEHRAMAKQYGGKPGEVRRMAKHCDRIAELNDELAAQYESMAKGEDAAAKE